MIPDKRHQVFVSSTYEDLKHERTVVMNACLEMGHIPIGMELFSAANATQWKVIQRTIEQCDYYVVIVADRYGSTVAEEGGISYTEKEYDYAISQGVPVLGFVLDPEADWPGSKRETDHAGQARLKQFKAKVRSRMAPAWRSAEDLATKVVLALGKAVISDPRPGWIPATMAANPVVSAEIARLSKENDELRKLIGSRPVFEIAAAIDQLARIRLETFHKAGMAPITLLDFFERLAPSLRSKRREDWLLNTVAQKYNLVTKPSGPALGREITFTALNHLEALRLVRPEVEWVGADQVHTWQLTENGAELNRGLYLQKNLSIPLITKIPANGS